MSSDTSGDEDNLELLREAADHQFINDTMFSGDNHAKRDVKSSGTEKPPSLRPSKQEEQFNALGVTPEFQVYVARRLATNLEERLTYSLATDSGDTTPNEKWRGRKGGIKLFKDSARFVKTVEATVTTKRRPLNDDDDDESKVKAASVSPSSVLSKADTLFWSNRSKAPVFKYRKTKDGRLVQANDSN